LHAFCASKPPQTLRWTGSIDAVLNELPRFFDDPTPGHHARTLKSVNLAIRAAQHTLQAWYAVPDARRSMQRIVGCLHFMRSALLDKDAPFNRHRH
ncbi:FUSC family protein, partial [Bacillus licheniformis]